MKINMIIKRTPAELRALARAATAQEARDAHWQQAVPHDSAFYKASRVLSQDSLRAMDWALGAARETRGEERHCSTCGGEGGWEEDQFSHSFGHYTTGRQCSECEGSGEGRNVLPEEDRANFTEEELKDGLLGWEMHLECSGLSPDEDEEHGCSYCARLKAEQDPAESNVA